MTSFHTFFYRVPRVTSPIGIVLFHLLDLCSVRESPDCTEEVDSLHPVPWYDCINLHRITVVAFNSWPYAIFFFAVNPSEVYSVITFYPGVLL